MPPKQRVPAALREAVWVRHNGRAYDAECAVRWCETALTPFSFEVGHNLPESRGGTLDIDNLRPICALCNRSMGSTYTIDQFSALALATTRSRHDDLPVKRSAFRRWLLAARCCFVVVDDAGAGGGGAMSAPSRFSSSH